MSPAARPQHRPPLARPATRSPRAAPRRRQLAPARWLVLALWSLALAAPAAAQTAGLSVAALGCKARDASILLQFKESVVGYCVGAVGMLQLGPLTIEGSGFRARRLEPAENTLALRRDGGEVRGIVGLAPVPWFSLEAGFGVRAFSSAAGYQRWLIPSGGVKLSATLGHPALAAYVRSHYLPPTLQRIPAGQATGEVKWNMGLVVESGVRLAPRRTPLVLGGSYRLERFDFPGGAAGRLEQFEVVSLYAGFRVGG